MMSPWRMLFSKVTILICMGSRFEITVANFTMDVGIANE